MNKKILSVLLLGVSMLGTATPSKASSGTEGAAFLDIPVGAGPAAMGSAYTSLATDAYAPTYNPAGLGFLNSTQFSGQHLSYLDSIHYEYLSFAVPLPRPSSCTNAADCPGSAIGGSVQYLGSGDIDGMDVDNANNPVPTGTFSSYYASYNLAYGRSFNDRLSIGMTGKIITAKLDDVSASAFAADLGAMYQLNPKLMLASTLTNMGSKLKFLDEGDPLPLAFHVAASYQPKAQWLATGEVVYPQTGLASVRVGGQWQPINMLKLRMGYRTDTVKELSPLAGLSAGFGVEVWGQELAYAWVPYGDLGNTHYISLLMKFGEIERMKRNLIQYQHVKTPKNGRDVEGTAPEYMQLMELLNDSEQRVARQNTNIPDSLLELLK